MTATYDLSRPFSIGTIELTNRIVIAPMTRSNAVDGILGAAHAAYCRPRSEGGVGRIDRSVSSNVGGIT